MASLEEFFQNLYDTALQEPLAEIRKLRKEHRTLFLRSLTVTGIAALVCIPPALLISTLSFFWKAVLWVIPIVCLFFFFRISFRNRKKKRMLFKTRVLTEIVSAIDPELTFKYDHHISEKAFRKSGLFTEQIDRFSGEDCVFGSYHNVAMVLSELHVENDTESIDRNGHRHPSRHAVFQGIFLIADFKKNFKTRTFVLPDTAENLFGSLIGNFLQEWNFARKENLVRLENTEFEKYFVVYAQNDVEARYLLSPKLMEQMVALRKRFNTRISFSFTDSSLNVAIPSARDFFEIPGGKLDCDAMKRCLYEFLYFLQIVDDLNLNVRLWSKE